MSLERVSKPALLNETGLDIIQQLQNIAAALGYNLVPTVGEICQNIIGSVNNTGHTINSGEYFIANGVKYQAMASISNGKVWAGSADPVEGNDLINALNSKLTVETSYVTKETGTDYIHLGTVKKCGGVKTLNIIIRGTQTALPQSAWTIVGSVDSSCKPSSTFSAQLIDLVTFKPFSLSVDTNGAVSMYNRTGGKPEGEWQVAYI